jgi:phage tail protein X
MNKYITKMYDRIDKICERAYGKTEDGVVEFVMKSNPDLLHHGIVLPMGLTVYLPNLPEKQKGTKQIRQIYLWD